MPSRLLSCLLVVAASVTVRAADWPQFRGPNRDDISTEKGLLKEWPKGGPPLAWSVGGLGGGYSSVSVVGDRIYTLGNRKGTTHIVALARDGGKEVWATPVGRTGDSLGCTPTVADGRVYALGQHGDLVCVDAQDGKEIWKRHLKKDFKGVCGGWNYCESPCVDGDKVIVTPGGKEATMVALDRKTGSDVWSCSLPLAHTEAGYSSVVIATAGGVRHYVQLLNGGVVGVAEDGRFLWKYEKLGPNTANVPTPVVLGDTIFAIAGYGKGAALLRLKADGKSSSASEVYFSSKMSNKHGGVVVVGEHVYGDMDDGGRPFCAEVATGKVVWRKERGQGSGSASVTYADGRLYVHYESGHVALIEASPDGYKETGLFRVPKQDGHSWAHPVVVDGRLYLREGNTLYCYDVRATP